MVNIETWREHEQIRIQTESMRISNILNALNNLLGSECEISIPQNGLQTLNDQKVIKIIRR